MELEEWPVDSVWLEMEVASVIVSVALPSVVLPPVSELGSDEFSVEELFSVGAWEDDSELTALEVSTYGCFGLQDVVKETVKRRAKTTQHRRMARLQ